MAAKYAAFLDLTGRLCVVVGGGPIADRKTRALLAAGARVRVVSPNATDGIAALVNSNQIEWIAAPFQPDHLDQAWLAFAATDRRDVNEAVTAAAQERLIFVNAADEADSGSLITPATVKRGDLIIAVTTLGASPTLATEIATDLESRFSPEYAEYVAILRDERERLKATVADANLRRSAVRALVDAGESIRALLRDGRTDAAREHAHALVSREIGRP